MVVVETVVVTFASEVVCVVSRIFSSVLVSFDKQQIRSCFENELNWSGKLKQGTTGIVLLQRDVESQQKY